MLKRIAQLAVLSSVVIIVWAAILAPVVAGSFWTTKDYSNVEQSVYYMDSPANVEPGTTINYTWNKAAGTIAANDTVYTLPDTAGYTWAYLGLGMLRITAGATDNFTAVLVVGDNHIANLNVSSGQNYQIGGDGFFISDKPTEYVMMKSTATGTYYSKDKPILFAGISQISGVLHTFRFDYDGAITWDNIVPSTSTVSNISINDTKVGVTSDVSQLHKITFDCTTSGGTTQLCTYVYGIAHAHITGHNSNDLAPIGSIIPLIALIGVVLAVVRVAIRARE